MRLETGFEEEIKGAHMHTYKQTLKYNLYVKRITKNLRAECDKIFLLRQVCKRMGWS